MRSKNVDKMHEIKKYAEQYYLDHYQSPSTTQIANQVGLARGTVYQYLVEMRDRGMISYNGKEIRTDMIEKVKPNVIRVAVLGSVSCGIPKFAEENIEEYVSLPESMFGKGTFYILRANGESMIEAGIEDGDMVVIRAQNYADDGQIVVALMEDEATLKRLYRENGKIRLHPENAEMEDIIVDECIIQGVAVKVIKDLS